MNTVKFRSIINYMRHKTRRVLHKLFFHTMPQPFEEQIIPFFAGASVYMIEDAFSFALMSLSQLSLLKQTYI